MPDRTHRKPPLPERAGRILRFIAATGCRPSEACGLKWADVHLNDRRCVLTKHKTANETGEGQERKFRELISSSYDQLREALENDPSGETADCLRNEIEVIAEKENPIRSRIREMQRDLPVSFGGQIHPLKNRPRCVGARQSISGGIKMSGEKSKRKVLLTYDAYVRTVHCAGCDTFRLTNLLAEYGLTRKANRIVGTSSKAWHNLQVDTPWNEY